MGCLVEFSLVWWISGGFCGFGVVLGISGGIRGGCRWISSGFCGMSMYFVDFWWNSGWFGGFRWISGGYCGVSCISGGIRGVSGGIRGGLVDVWKILWFWSVSGDFWWDSGSSGDINLP